MACRYAKKLAEKKKYFGKVISTWIRGEAKEVGKDLAEYTIFFPRNNCILIAGGETTVTVEGNGKGGRNQEMVLASVRNISNEAIVFLSCGTDGIDGNSSAAGAIADGYSHKKADLYRMEEEAYLANNNSYEFFEKLGDDITTGYTGTNVMDIQIIVKL